MAKNALSPVALLGQSSAPGNQLIAQPRDRDHTCRKGGQLSHAWHCVACVESVLILLTLMVLALTALWVTMGESPALCTAWLTYSVTVITTLRELSGFPCQRQTPVIINELMIMLGENMQHHLRLAGSWRSSGMQCARVALTQVMSATSCHPPIKKLNWGTPYFQ